MRILVLSDSHGSSSRLLSAINARSGASLIIHLGDGERDMEAAAKYCGDTPIIQLRGNCDLGSDAPLCVCESAGGRTIFCSHGFVESVKYGDAAIVERAREAGADILLYGHTHTPVTDYRDGLYIMNPGSVREGCCGTVDITPAGIVCCIFRC